MAYFWLTRRLRAHARFPVVLRGSLELSAVQPSAAVAARSAQLNPCTAALAGGREHRFDRPGAHNVATEVADRRRAVGGEEQEGELHHRVLRIDREGAAADGPRRA